VAAAAVAVTEVVLPFCRATNGLLSVPKCIGIMLGPQAASPPVGPEPLTGMQFVQPGKSVRHLGILLSATAQEAATEQMFDKRGEAIRLRINAWSRFDLSGLGRLHVAKQVLASSFYYHATFLMPWDALLAKIVKSIDWFVAKGCLEEGPIRPLIHMPSKAVESLPWDMGGVQRQWISLHKCTRPCRPKWRPCFCIHVAMHGRC
jgi:hypothetical protein